MSLHEIISPLPGTFYRKPAPDAEPFVKEGDFIQAGDTIGIVEVMKQFTEIKTDISGIVENFLIQDGAPVEPGQPVLIIKVEQNND